jgi:carboxymethylenebutenolidase
MDHQDKPPGYLALPSSSHGLPVLVLHAWWGLNATVRATCDRLAAEGFVAFAPDLYHGKLADTIPGAEALARALDARHLQAKAQVAQGARFLQQRAGREHRGVAVIGFSLGAYYALDLAAAEPGRVHSVVLFYGTGGGDWSRSRAAYLGHFAEPDDYEPKAEVDALEAALRRAGRRVVFHRYPGSGHWFFEPDRTQAYDPAAAALAWERTLAFLKPVAAPAPDLQAPNVVVISQRLVTSGQPSAQALASLGAQGYGAVIYLAPPGMPDAVPDEAQIVRRQGMEYVELPIRFDRPAPSDVEAFAAAMQRLGGRKLLVHCQVNMRASSMVFLYRVLVEREDPERAYEAVARVWSPSGPWKALIAGELRKAGIAFDIY